MVMLCYVYKIPFLTCCGCCCWPITFCAPITPVGWGIPPIPAGGKVGGVAIPVGATFGAWLLTGGGATWVGCWGAPWLGCWGNWFMPPCCICGPRFVRQKTKRVTLYSIDRWYNSYTGRWWLGKTTTRG